MDESFKARLDKVFGSLASTPRSSSLWSIADHQLQRREWRRSSSGSARDDTPCSSSFRQLFVKDRRRTSPSLGSGNIHHQDDQAVWNIRSSIGLDPTLDFEEEEDEFDKVASGRENAGHRLYMTHITEQVSYFNSENLLRNNKDLRANHLAAKFRLKEDDDDALKLASHAKASTDQAQLRPILKRKDDETDFKSQKRVRFDVGSQNASEETSAKNAAGPIYRSDLANRDSRVVPDYLVNPSKYKRYSLDSTTEVDEASNARACGDFLNQVKTVHREAASDMENTCSALPESVTFIPKKKACEAKSVDDCNDRGQTLHQEGFRVGIAVREVEGQISEDEDEPEIRAAEGGAGFRISGRRYRKMSKSADCDTS